VAQHVPAPIAAVAFDREVMRRELVRDGQLATATRTPVVETWHVGNIAYARARGHDLADDYEQTRDRHARRRRHGRGGVVTTILPTMSVIVVRLRMSDANYAERMAATGLDGADRLALRREVEPNVDDLLGRLRHHSLAVTDLVLDGRSVATVRHDLVGLLGQLADT